MVSKLRHRLVRDRRPGEVPPPSPPPALGWRLGTPGVTCNAHCSGVGKTCGDTRFTSYGTVDSCSETTDLTTALGVTGQFLCNGELVIRRTFTASHRALSRRENYVHHQQSGTYTCSMTPSDRATPICPWHRHFVRKKKKKMTYTK